MNKRVKQRPDVDHKRTDSCVEGVNQSGIIEPSSQNRFYLVFSKFWEVRELKTAKNEEQKKSPS
jgi:hypothetical protein